MLNVEYSEQRQSTRSCVFDIFYNYDKSDTSKVSYKEYRDLFNSGLELEDSLIEELKGYIMCQEPNTSFIQNLQAILKDGYVIDKMFGYVVCIHNMYMKSKEKELKNALKTKLNSESAYVGVEGAKVTIDVTFTNVNWYESAFNGKVVSTGMFSFLDDDNNQIVWKTSAGKALDIGSKYTVTAKVKEHKDYRGVKQTIILRPKFVELL